MQCNHLYEPSPAPVGDLLICSAAAAFAQTTTTPLKNLTASYELQRSVLTSNYESQVKAPRERYIAALTTAQKAAAAATVLVLVVATCVVGPILAQRYARKIKEASNSERLSAETATVANALS
jgi:hypothetical protein